ncbi:MAG: cohesin domain-containing protein [Gammaproteobacteria bacterium]|nr:cohesin domain-containing protein [Gammaproteobacteria bacterium]
MIKKVIATLAFSAVLAAGANASTLSISGPDKVTVGESFSLSVFADGFLEGLLTGGAVVMFDPSLVQLVGVKLAPLPNLDPNFSCPGGPACPDLGPGNGLMIWGAGIGFNMLPDGFGKMADVNFRAIAAGSVLFSLMTFDDAGGWLGPNLDPIPVPEFNEWKIGINDVPLPAAVWLMAGGLASLPGFGRARPTG